MSAARPYVLIRVGRPPVEFATVEEPQKIWKSAMYAGVARGTAVIKGPNGFEVHCDAYPGAEWKPGDGRHKADRVA